MVMNSVDLYAQYISELSLRGLFGRKPARRDDDEKPSKSADDFHRTATASKNYAGYHTGTMKASEFAKHDIDNHKRSDDPRLRAIHKSIGKTGIREPIAMGRGSDGRIRVSDGGHRVTSAIKHYRDTGRDIDIPYNYKPN